MSAFGGKADILRALLRGKDQETEQPSTGILAGLPKIGDRECIRCGHLPRGEGPSVAMEIDSNQINRGKRAYVRRSHASATLAEDRPSPKRGPPNKGWWHSWALGLATDQRPFSCQGRKKDHGPPGSFRGGLPVFLFFIFYNPISRIYAAEKSGGRFLSGPFMLFMASRVKRVVGFPTPPPSAPELGLLPLHASHQRRVGVFLTCTAAHFFRGQRLLTGPDGPTDYRPGFFYASRPTPTTPPSP
jgi:hypothetical protein